MDIISGDYSPLSVQMILKKVASYSLTQCGFAFFTYAMAESQKQKKNINLDTKLQAIAKNIYHRSIIFKPTSKVGMHTLKSLRGLGFS